MKYCSNCGSKLEEDQAFCSSCGKAVNGKKTVNKKKKIPINHIIRYIFGGLFILAGFLSLSCGSLNGLITILIGLSLFPIIYKKLISKIIFDYEWLIFFQISLPILLFILLLFMPSIKIGSNNVSTNNTSTVINEETEETEEEKLLRSLNRNLSTNQELLNYEINSETGNYDFKIKEDKTALNAYTCASDAQYFVKKLNGIEKIGNIEFECLKNSETFYYVSIENVSNITSDNINENTKYYDVNHNKIDTNIDKLKDEEVNDYKKLCATYSYKDVLRNPSEYSGKQAYWFGKIVQVVDKSSYSSTFRIDVNCEKYSYIDGYYCNDTIYVIYLGSQSFIEDDMVKMWGIMSGTETYTTVLGTSVTIPKFNAKYMELQ